MDYYYSYFYCFINFIITCSISLFLIFQSSQFTTNTYGYGHGYYWKQCHPKDLLDCVFEKKKIFGRLPELHVF